MATVEREQKGGVIFENGRPVGYTREGAEAAVQGGPVDSSIIPNFLEDQTPGGQEPERGETVRPRTPGLTEEQQKAAREAKEAGENKGTRGTPGDPGAPGVTREDAAPLIGEETDRPTPRRRSS